MLDIHNGIGGKGLEAEQGQPSHAVAGPDEQTGRGKNGESGGKKVKGWRFCQCLQLGLEPVCSPDVGSLLSLSAMNGASLAAAGGSGGSTTWLTLFLIV